jgi:Flp pilus assembly protein TadB
MSHSLDNKCGQNNNKKKCERMTFFCFCCATATVVVVVVVVASWALVLFLILSKVEFRTAITKRRSGERVKLFSHIKKLLQ